MRQLSLPVRSRLGTTVSDHACPSCGYIHPNMDDPDVVVGGDEYYTDRQLTFKPLRIPDSFGPKWRDL